MSPDYEMMQCSTRAQPATELNKGHGAIVDPISDPVLSDSIRKDF